MIDYSVNSREARMRKLASGDPMEEFGDDRRCAAEACGALLSRYNPGSTCGVHRGWHGEPQVRRRSRA